MQTDKTKIAFFLNTASTSYVFESEQALVAFSQKLLAEAGETTKECWKMEVLEGKWEGKSAMLAHFKEFLACGWYKILEYHDYTPVKPWKQRTIQ